MSESALAVVDVEPTAIEKPSALMGRGRDVAAVCGEIVKRTAMELQGKKYVKVEGWQSIAAAYGCVPSIKEVAEEERGIRAVAELKRADGTVIAAAEGYCGLDEPRWASQPLYARRGMAQTRAISRVCRSAFAFVVTLIDADLSTTPAEEIPQGGEANGHAAPVRVARTATPANGTAPPPVRDNSTKVRFGKSKGKFLCDIEPDDLQWQLAAARKSVEANDPKWHQQNAAWFATVQAECARRGLAT